MNGGFQLQFFEMNEKHQVAVLEMGVNHFGEMRRLSSVASPDICVITNIGIAHLEFFQNKRRDSSGKISDDPGYEDRWFYSSERRR